MNINKTAILNKLDKLKEPKILVAGDFGIDEMYSGKLPEFHAKHPF